MAEMTVKNTGRKHVCSVYKCTDNNTLMVHRGKHSSFESLFLCENCIRDIVGGYIETVGKERAAEVLGGVIKPIVAADKKAEKTADTTAEAVNEEKTAKKKESKGA
jgi:hypothetical protein